MHPRRGKPDSPCSAISYAVYERVRMGVTVRDVASVAGVSAATVSRALRGFDTVDPTIRARVLATAERIGYVGSHAAAALSTGRADSIAIITPFVDRLSFQRMLTGAGRELHSAGIDLLVYCTGDPSDPHPVPPTKRLARRVDGFISFSLSDKSPDLADILSLKMPLALFGATAPGASSVQIDDRFGATTAVQHLLDLGHRRIGVIYGREAADPTVLEHQRHLGVRDAFNGAGLSFPPELLVQGGYTLAGGVRAMDALLALQHPPTAVFSFSDEMAYGAIHSIRRHGMILGKDIALIGYDGHEMSSILDLSTISVPFEEIGALTARQVLEQLDHLGAAPKTSAQQLPTELVIRSSTQVSTGV